MSHKPGVMFKKLWEENGQNECWPWIGCINPVTGYGKKTYYKKDWLAHRWMYEQKIGPIPEGKVINHLCSNRACVNPAHLEITSQAGNCRHGKGTKLTADKVMEIKKEKPNRSKGLQKELAEKFNISYTTINDIWNGRSWND